MSRRIAFLIAVVSIASVCIATAQAPKPFKPVTDAMLANPSPNDWLMFSRTYDAQRYSPLAQINRDNVKNLKLAYAVAIGGSSFFEVSLPNGATAYTRAGEFHLDAQGRLVTKEGYGVLGEAVEEAA